MKKSVKFSQVPAFYKVYTPHSCSRKMELPPNFLQIISQGSIPRKLILRNRCGGLWTVGLGGKGKDLFFQGAGWIQFITDNNILEGYLLVFNFNGMDTFDVNIFEHSGWEKIDDYHEEEAKVDVEEDLLEVKDEDGVAEEGGDELESNADEGYDTTPAGMQDEEKAGENSGKRERNGKKKAKGEYIDIYGSDIFKSGRYIRPTNPYFVTKLRGQRRDQLHIPADFIKDLEYDLPEELIVHDPQGKTYRLHMNGWNDGRLWYKEGWSRLCRSNLVEAKDRIICEFIRKAEMQVTIICPGNSSN